jgi:hypothetical protein
LGQRESALGTEERAFRRQLAAMKTDGHAGSKVYAYLTVKGGLKTVTRSRSL